MPMPKLELNDQQLAVYLETNQHVDVARLSSFLEALNEFALDYFQEDPRLELSQLRTGSVIAVFTAWGAVAGGIGTMGIFALALAERIENYRQRKFERRAAEHVLDDGVVRFEFGAKGIETITVPANKVAAISTILAERDNLARPALTPGGKWVSDIEEIDDEEEALRLLEEGGFDYLVTEEGEPITTETGEPISIGRLTGPKPASDIDESQGWMQMAGQFVSEYDGRFALFRSGAREYQIAGTPQSLAALPTDREVVVEVVFKNDGSLVLRRWRPATLGQWEG